MVTNGLYPVDFCQEGKDYYLKKRNGNGEIDIKRVKFWSYRPHPAEVVVIIDGVKTLAYRSDLFYCAVRDSGSN